MSSVMSGICRCGDPLRDEQLKMAAVRPDVCIVCECIDEILDKKEASLTALGGEIARKTAIAKADRRRAQSEDGHAIPQAQTQESID